MIVSFIGAGKMGEALISGGIASGSLQPENIYLSDVRKESLGCLRSKYNVKISDNNIDAVKVADFIILAVKPQNIDEVLDEIAGYVDGSKTIVSIAAGINIERITQKLHKESQIIRVMPNNPALLRAGISVISASSGVSKSALEFVTKIFLGVGEVVFLDEKYQNLATALSGSGPAYFYLLVKLLIEAGIKLGLKPDISEKLVKQTLFGSAKMIKEIKKSPEELIKMVASPGGTTEAALKVFEKFNLKKGVVEAVRKAESRAIELGERKIN